MRGALLLALSVSLVHAAAAAWSTGRARRRCLPMQTHCRGRACEVPGWWRAAAWDAALPGDPGRWWRAWLAALVSVPFVAAAARRPALAVLGFTVLVPAPLLVRVSFRGRGRARYEAQLPDALEAVAASLRSGAALLGAVQEAARVGGEVGADFALVYERATVVGLRAAASHWAESRPFPGVLLAVAALSLAAEEGGAQARALDGLALSVRQSVAARAEAHALGTQARVSALVIAAAPLVFGLLTAGADPRTAQFLLGSVPGLVCLATGLALDVAGAVWMARISTGAAGPG